MAGTPIFYQQERSFILFASKHLTKSDILVYDVLCANSYGSFGTNYIVSMGYKAIKDQAGISRSTAIASCKHLEKKGVIKRKGFNSAKCVQWILVRQSPAGIKAAQEAAIKAAQEEIGGVREPGHPTDEEVRDPGPAKSAGPDQQSPAAATLLRTREEKQDPSVSPTPEATEPEPGPEASEYDLNARQAAIIAFNRANGGLSMRELAEWTAQGWKDGEPVNDTTPTAAYLRQLERLHDGDG